MEAQAQNDNTPKAQPDTSLNYTYEVRSVWSDEWEPKKFLPGYLAGVKEIVLGKQILGDGEFYKYVTFGNDESASRLSLYDGPVYVNVYTITREYGGPEEGGWWYDHEEPTESHESSREDCYDLADRLRAEWGGGSDSLGRVNSRQYRVKIEPHNGSRSPRPRYE